MACLLAPLLGQGGLCGLDHVVEPRLQDGLLSKSGSNVVLRCISGEIYSFAIEKKFFMCLFSFCLLGGRQRLTLTEQDLPLDLLVHFPNAGLGQIKAWSLELNLGFPGGWQGPKCLNHHPAASQGVH